MRDTCPYIFLLGPLLGWLAFILPASCSADGFPMICTVDYRNPVPPDLLKRAGIQNVYISVGMPLKSDAAGGRVLDEKIKPQLDELFASYRDNGIMVLLVLNFYTRPPDGTECIDASGRKMDMGCFNNPDFLNSMAKEIGDIAEVFSAYDAFGGFVFDDGAQVRVDCCYCDVCKRLFKEKHGVDPPPFEPYDGGPRLDPNDPRLLWDAFQRDAYAHYLQTQAEAARSVSDRLFLATIPADSYFYGRQLNIDVARGETSTRNSARLQRIERIQVKNWHIFQSFPFPLVVTDGAGLLPFGAGCHLTTPSPGIIIHTEGPFIEEMGRQQFLSPSEISRLMRTTIAEGANRICFWNNARAIPYYPEGFDAIGTVTADVAKIAKALEARKEFPARVGLLYSTVTEILQQPWRKNTLERWKHLHSFEAMAYALTRRSVQFRVVFDNQLDEAMLSDLDVVLMTGVTHLTKPAAEMLEKAVAAGKLKVFTDRASLPIKGAVVCEFDQDFWFNKQLKGYRQVRYLNQEAAQIWEAVLPKLDLPRMQPAVVSSDSGFAKFFKGGDDSLLVFIVNWDIENDIPVRLEFPEPHIVKDEASGQEIGQGKSLELMVVPAGWRVIRCVKKN